MALPLTVFRTFPYNVPISETVVYTAPTGYNSIVLTAQAVNTDNAAQPFWMYLVRGTNHQPIVGNYQIPSNEVLIASGGNAGKLVLQTGDSLSIKGQSPNIYFTLSVLETLI